jgi:iron only hydrogenase large subunit-like protein
MLEQQSIDEFMNQLLNGDKSVIVSVSPQSRASLASYYGITPLQVMPLPGFQV